LRLDWPLVIDVLHEELTAFVFRADEEGYTESEGSKLLRNFSDYL